jgi:YbbR domain-containing protein
MEYYLPLKVENIKPGRIIVSSLPSQVLVRLRGSGRALIFISVFATAEVRLDLTDINHLHEFHITPKMVKLPSALNATVNEIIKPEIITIELDEIVFKELPVKSHVELTLEPGYVLANKIRTDPSHVRVEGPLSRFRTIHYLETEQLRFDEVNHNITQNAALKSLNAHFKLFSEKVKVIIEVDKIVEATFEGIAPIIKGLPENLEAQLYPSTINVIVKGASSKIKSLAKSHISAEIDYQTQPFKSGVKIIPRVSVPKEVDLLKIEPDSIRISLHKTSN